MEDSTIAATPTPMEGAMEVEGDRSTSTSTALLVVMYGVAFVSAFNENIINVALIDIAGAFAATTATAQWLITGYMIVTSVITASMGYLARRFSTRQLFFVAAGCLLVGELACLAATSFPVLLAFRLLQAVGSGIFFPLMMNVVLDVAPKRKIGLYLSLGGACITLGPAFGPVVSGLMVTLSGWRGIFVVPAVAIAVLGLAGIALVRNVHEASEARLDLPSLLMLAAGLTSLVFGLGELTGDLPVALAAIALAVVVMAAFVRRQGALDEPLLDMRPMANPGFWPACILVVVAMMTTFSMSVLLPLYFEGALGYGALLAGVLILPAIAVNAVTSVAGGRIMDGHGEWPLLPVGFALVLVGLVAVALTSTSLSVVAVVAFSAVAYAGVGLVLSPSQTAGLRILDAAQHGSGTAIINTFVMVAASIGPSLFIGLLSSGAATAEAAGSTAAVAQASGFALAVGVAAVVGAAGLAVSMWYARHMSKVRDAR